jgi:predicted membrane channel-forming protein YqfA (hemolysin III family)
MDTIPIMHNAKQYRSSTTGACPMSVRNLLLIGFTLACVAAAFLLPAVPQPLAYHNFADQRSFLGIPHFNNVVSNIGFFLAGTLGLALLIRSRVRFEFMRERWPYLVFFFGIFATALGSSYYHLAPDNDRLFWDRLPMTITFMALVASQISDRISVRTGLVLLVPMLLIGASSVIYWRVTERQGVGNVLPYAMLQAYAVLALLFLAILQPSRYSRGSDLYWIFSWYVLSKVLETYDAEILSLSHFVSGHTLKHFAASLGGFIACYMLINRVLQHPATTADESLKTPSPLP